MVAIYSMQQSCNIHACNMQQWYTNFLMQVSVVPPSFSVTMASVSPPPFDVMGLGRALTEVMRETAVSFLLILTVTNFCSLLAVDSYFLLPFIQFPVKVEHFDAAMVSAPSSLAAAMEIKTALIAVMRLDVVSV